MTGGLKSNWNDLKDEVFNRNIFSQKFAVVGLLTFV